MKATFFNGGNYFFFNPSAMIYPPNNQPPQKAIDFYNDLVSLMNRKDCFVVTAMPKSWHHNKFERIKAEKLAARKKNKK